MRIAPAPIAYLTCELRGRDFPSRAVIAKALLAAGYPVILGQQWAMWRNIATAPKGCFLFKSTNMTQAEAMRRCQEAGHVVIAADEECLASSRSDIARSTHPDAITYCDAFLALNEIHREVLVAAYPEAASRVVVTGNVRVDLLRESVPPSPRSAPYLLFNTSFGIINSMWGDAERAAAVWINSGGHGPGDDTVALVQERVHFEQRTMRETQDLLAWIIANTSLDIVIRPHPQERPDRWNLLHPGRITVVPSSDSIPWMRHALITIHSESTTGVEAAIMGVRVLNLSPGGWKGRLIVSEVNPTVSSAQGAASLIAAFLEQGVWPASARSASQMYPPGGTERTVAAIVRALPPPGGVGELKWFKRDRSDVEKKKFALSMSDLTATLSCRAMELDDSIFYLEPQRTPR